MLDKHTLRQMPTLCEAQADDLKVDTGTIRIWLSRIDESISVEVWTEKEWKLFGPFECVGQAFAIRSDIMPQ